MVERILFPFKKLKALLSQLPMEPPAILERRPLRLFRVALFDRL
jgi:hypothetical protein